MSPVFQGLGYNWRFWKRIKTQEAGLVPMVVYSLEDLTPFRERHTAAPGQCHPTGFRWQFNHSSRAFSVWRDAEMEPVLRKDLEFPVSLSVSFPVSVKKCSAGSDSEERGFVSAHRVREAKASGAWLSCSQQISS